MLTYDGVVEADAAHETVVVFSGADGDIWTAGTVTASDSSLQVGDAAGSTAGSGLLDTLVLVRRAARTVGAGGGDRCGSRRADGVRGRVLET